MNKSIAIGDRIIGHEKPVFVIAEMSGNHNMDFKRAVEIIEAAKYAGADAVKLQTYTPDTITMNSHKPWFMTQKGSLWEGQTLYELYSAAYTPWEWQEELNEKAKACGLLLFSSPFDLTSVDFLEKMQVPAYKVASFEINDIPLIRKIARTGKPVIISTGIALMSDIEEAVAVCREEGNDNVVLLKCVSSYPAPFEDMNLKTITNMQETFGCVTGLSDHSFGPETAVASIALGAKVIEKHLTLRRDDGGPDAGFSMEPDEFKEMVEQIRHVECALGKVTYELNARQMESRKGSRSLFVVKDIRRGEKFTEDNVRSIRPGIGLHTRYYDDILGKKANTDIEAGEPLQWKHITWETDGSKGQ